LFRPDPGAASAACDCLLHVCRAARPTPSNPGITGKIATSKGALFRLATQAALSKSGPTAMCGYAPGELFTIQSL